VTKHPFGMLPGQRASAGPGPACRAGGAIRGDRGRGARANLRGMVVLLEAVVGARWPAYGIKQAWSPRTPCSASSLRFCVAPFRDERSGTSIVRSGRRLPPVPVRLPGAFPPRSVRARYLRLPGVLRPPSRSPRAVACSQRLSNDTSLRMDGPCVSRMMTRRCFPLPDGPSTSGGAVRSSRSRSSASLPRGRCGYGSAGRRARRQCWTGRLEGPVREARARTAPRAVTSR
jgi:hypothetical protein